MIRVVEMLPRITCHDIKMTLNGFYVFSIVQVEIQQMISAQVIPSTSLTYVLEIGVFGCHRRTCVHEITSCSFGYVVTKIQVGVQIFQSMEFIIQLYISQTT